MAATETLARFVRHFLNCFSPPSPPRDAHSEHQKGYHSWRQVWCGGACVRAQALVGPDGGLTCSPMYIEALPADFAWGAATAAYQIEGTHFIYSSSCLRDARIALHCTRDARIALHARNRPPIVLTGAKKTCL